MANGERRGHLSWKGQCAERVGALLPTTQRHGGAKIILGGLALPHIFPSLGACLVGGWLPIPFSLSGGKFTGVMLLDNWQVWRGSGAAGFSELLGCSLAHDHGTLISVAVFTSPSAVCVCEVSLCFYYQHTGDGTWHPLT